MRAFLLGGSLWLLQFMSMNGFAHALDSIRELKAGDVRQGTTQRNHHSGLVLVLFYSSQCPHCQAFAPIIQAFAKQNDWILEPISADGQTLPGFAYTIPADPSMLKKAFQTREIQYPAMFIADKKSQMLYPISFGNVTYQELSVRVNQFEALPIQGGRL
jgi:thiol-disulfide isomerase/thioredoxin